jgi:hypothetical protein
MSNKNHGQEQAKVLTSDEMNYLIYRYLQECGECLQPASAHGINSQHAAAS